MNTIFFRCSKEKIAQKKSSPFGKAGPFASVNWKVFFNLSGCLRNCLPIHQ
jgi:hypothetical protein